MRLSEGRLAKPSRRSATTIALLMIRVTPIPPLCGDDPENPSPRLRDGKRARPGESRGRNGEGSNPRGLNRRRLPRASKSLMPLPLACRRTAFAFFSSACDDLGIEPRFPECAEFPELPILDRRAARDGTSRWAYRQRWPASGFHALDVLRDPRDTRLVNVKQAIGDLAYLRPNKSLVRRPSDDAAPYQTEPLSAYQVARRAGSRELFNTDVPSIREDTVERLKQFRLAAISGTFRRRCRPATCRAKSGDLSLGARPEPQIFFCLPEAASGSL